MNKIKNPYKIWKLQKSSLAILFLKNELEMHVTLLKSFGMKDSEVIVNAYPHDVDMAKKQTSFSFNIVEM